MAYEIETKDGIVIRNIPDDIKPDDPRLRQRVAEERSLSHEQAMLDPTSNMSWMQKFGAGMGKAFVDVGRGVGQLLGVTEREDVKKSRELDAPLMKTGAGLAGNITGNVAALAPTLAIPGVNTVGGAAALGAAMGLAAPSASTSETMMNVGGGAILGAGSQKIANMLTRPAASNLNPEQLRLARMAANEGIPLSATQQTGSRALRAADAAFENIPSTAGAQAATQRTQQEAFTAAALKRAGIQGENLATPPVLGSQKAALGQIFEDIAGRNSLMLDDPLLNELSGVVTNATKRLTPDKAAVVSRIVDDILEQSQSGQILGTQYQGWRSELGRLSRGNDTEAHYFSQLKKALDNAFSSQISGADSQAWKQASREYGNLKTIVDAMGGAGVNPASGNLQPAQLSRSLTSSVGREGKALGRGDLNDLSKVGSAFISDKVPDSGTAQRLLAQALMGGTAGGLVTGDPMGALAAGGAGLAAPALVRALLYSNTGQKALTKGLINNPSIVNALKAAPQLSLAPYLSGN